MKLGNSVHLSSLAPFTTAIISVRPVNRERHGAYEIRFSTGSITNNSRYTPRLLLIINNRRADSRM